MAKDVSEMDEKAVEDWLHAQLLVCQRALTELTLHGSEAGAPDIRTLLRGFEFELIKDSSAWNTHPGLMVDIIGGMTPDLVVRSKASQENRIIIEVKLHAGLGHDVEASQLARYFLHLLATSRESRGEDIPRAVVLAAPKAWFEVRANADGWKHFTSHFGGLAGHFGIVLAAIHIPEQLHRKS